MWIRSLFKEKSWINFVFLFSAFCLSSIWSNLAISKPISGKTKKSLSSENLDNDMFYEKIYILKDSNSEIFYKTIDNIFKWISSVMN